jgi:hypothetical protein
VRNFKAKSRGGWSLVSAALSTVGNAIRVFTTITLANANPLLLAQARLATAPGSRDPPLAVPADHVVLKLPLFIFSSCPQFVLGTALNGILAIMCLIWAD